MPAHPAATRLEADLLGQLALPAEALYGVRTQRALDLFPLAGQRALGGYPTLIDALLLVKQAAALANQRCGALPADKAQAIFAAAADLLAHPDPALFPVHALHGGGGIAANMNVNEVLANLGEERLGGRRGEYRQLHPNDHVNLNQSTNDVYPTAGHLAVLLQWRRLRPALEALATAFADQAHALRHMRRLARTCLQDAVEITVVEFCSGTIVGRPADVPPAYFAAILPALREVTGEPRFERPANLFDAFQNPEDLAAVSAELDLLARSLIKQAQDLRLLSSGPEAGLGEISLPAVLPGSSIMPGKINPTIPEFVMQLAFKVQGLHTMVAAGVNHGELDLNIWEGTALCGLLEAMELLESALTSFAEQCVRGLGVHRERNARNADTLIPWLTRLALQHGYSTVTAICKEARGDDRLLRELLAARLGE